MVKVALRDVRFFAYHGFYADEQVLGNHFVVDVAVCFQQEHHFADDQIAHTINYEELHSIIATEMKHTRKLLETVVQGIIDNIKTQFPLVESICASIKKLNPPLPGQVGSSLIEITYSKPHDL